MREPNAEMAVMWNGPSAERWLALEASRLVLEVREAVADFFHIPDSSRVVFTSNATETINRALFGLLQPGDPDFNIILP